MLTAVRLLLCALFVSLAVPSASHAGWARVGGEDIASPHVFGDHDLQVVGGVPYLAWSEGDTGTVQQLRVARFVGNQWHVIGSSLNRNPAQHAIEPEIADVGGVPWVTWSETNDIDLFTTPDDGLVYVSRLVNDAWQAAGGALNVWPSARAYEPTITGVNGFPYVAFTQTSAISDKLFVSTRSFRGTSWSSSQPLGDASTNETHSPHLASVGGKPWIAFARRGTTASSLDWVYGAYRDDTNLGPWTETQAISSAGGARVGDVVDYQGKPLLLMMDNGRVRLVRYRPGIWYADELPSPAGDDRYYLGDIAVAGDQLYWAGSQADPEFRVRRYDADGGDWDGIAGAVTESTHELPIIHPQVVVQDGIPFTSWADTRYGPALAHQEIPGELRSARLEPEFVSGHAIATDTSAMLTAEVRTFGVPFPLWFQHGPGPNPNAGSAAVTAPEGVQVAAVRHTLADLAPSTGHSWRVVGVNAVASPLYAFTTTAVNGPGPAGPVGPAGPAGAPAVVTCKVKKTKGAKKVRVRCTVNVAAARSARLVRGRRTLARRKVAAGRRTVVFRVPERRARGTLRLVF